MPDFVLRNLDDDLMNKLHHRAAQHGRTADVELLQILRDALLAPQAGSAAELQQLAADIRALSDQRRQTASEELLRVGR